MMKIHQIKIDFHVTDQIKRYVYVYVLEAKSCYLIDSGVYGSEKQIADYLRKIGRGVADVKGILLTHAHPDHIGTAAWFKAHTGCQIYASAGEKEWIENIDLQFKERPIPNFYKLAGESVKIDKEVRSGDELSLEEGLTVRVLGTPGHSAGEVSYVVGNAAFIGDALPVKGDIPIYINKEDAIDSINKLGKLEHVTCFYPAWDRAYSDAEIQAKINAALGIIDAIEGAVEGILGKNQRHDLKSLTAGVCKELNMPFLMSNPLFQSTVLSHVNKMD